MTTHYSKEFNVTTYTILGSHQSVKDQTKNVYIRVRINSKKSTKRKIKERRYDIPVIDVNEENVSLTPNQFATYRFNPKTKHRIAEIEERVKFATHHYLSHRKDFNTKKLREFVYGDMENQARVFSHEYETNPEIVEQFQQHLPDEYKDDKFPKEVINKFKSLPDDQFVDSDTGEQIDFGDIINTLEVDYIDKRREEELSSLSVNDRYKRGLYDKTNIFSLFGFCHSINDKTGKPFVANSYKSLLLRLADFRFNRNPKESIEYFNLDWVDDFLIFLREEGYATKRIKQLNPFTLSKYSNDIILSERNPYTYHSFDKQVKHLKFYIETLQTNKILTRSIIDTRDIKTSNYVKSNGVMFTRTSHSLLQSEIHDLMNARLTGKKETARIMFLLQTLAGGLRTDEFTNQYFKLKKTNKDKYYFSFYANKVSDFQENPLIEDYSDVVLEQINYKLPKFLDVDEYRELVKEVASDAGLTREIRINIPMASGDNKVDDKPIYEIINPYWCRKSFVKLGRTLGWTDELIASFTGHSDPKIISRHYFDKLSLDDKERQVKKS